MVFCFGLNTPDGKKNGKKWKKDGINRDYLERRVEMIEIMPVVLKSGAENSEHSFMGLALLILLIFMIVSILKEKK